MESKKSPTKNCISCGKSYTKKNNEAKSSWETRRYCSSTCTAKTRIFSDATKRKMSEAHRGNKSHLWRGGITEKNYSKRRRLMGTFEYRLWRKAVFERDNYTCVWCKVKNGDGKTIKFQADHIKPFALYPELRFSIDNGRTLCVPCHKTTDTYAGKIKSYPGYKIKTKDF